jgi:mannose-6-phosphate isomerase-like protein (cupin superfamily)
MKNLSVVIALVFTVIMTSIQALAESEKRISEVVTAENVQWGYLNPLRGDKSPGAANLWGDRTRNSATGMLVKFNKGFSSPPHIHNISYRGVVIEGLMHNDDPSAEIMWMPAGSFWTQPAGENHITAANGATNLIYLEIDSGPYLVHPADQHFDNGERPVNLHESNLVWLNRDDAKPVEGTVAEITHLWGSAHPDEMAGAMVKLPAGFSGTLRADASEFRAVVITGSLSYRSSETLASVSLAPGSYFGSGALFEHVLTAEEGALVYIRANGRYDFVSR